MRVPAYSPVNTVNPTFLGSSFAEYTQQMKIKSNPQTHAVSITPGVFVTLHTLLPKKKTERGRKNRDADSGVCEALM